MKLIEDRIYNYEVKKDFISKAACIYDMKLCVGNHDIVIYANKSLKKICELLVDYICDYSVEIPIVKYIESDNDNKLTISTVRYYFDIINKFFCLQGYDLITDCKNKIILKFKNTEVSIYKNLCSMPCRLSEKYSQTVLIGKILSLCDVLKKTEFLRIEYYPQVPAILDDKMKGVFHYDYLHDLAMYIDRYHDQIDWYKVFDILSQMHINSQCLYLLKVFNGLYELIPDEFFISFIKNHRQSIDKTPPDEILDAMRSICTVDELLNNDFRSLYRYFLSNDNKTQRFYNYLECPDELSFDERRLMFSFDQKNHNNPHGTCVFHGSENDDSDELSLSWGVWSCGSKLSFLIKFYNKFINQENDDAHLENCRIEIPIVAADNSSHKFTEIFIVPFFNELGKLCFSISDTMGRDSELCYNMNYDYKIDGQDIIISMSIEKSYLHIPKDGMFGFDMLISCADSNSFYEKHPFRKTLSWMGCELKWRYLLIYDKMVLSI